jgi:O-methyltransferase involved in polyketide biosynthesis
MTLYHRALETQRADGIICERPAVEIDRQTNASKLMNNLFENC